MFLIDKVTNSIKTLYPKSFAELGFKERAYLQEWIASNPVALGEKLLIIQKEFSGFHETNERLDLLALDKEGNLVVIENKLDDSWKVVTWQALKYAAYCSTLSKDQIEELFQAYLTAQGIDKSAINILNEFFDEVPYNEISINKGNLQRIILIAAHFRKEVTSTVLWLISHKMKIQCFKTTPYEMNGQYLLPLGQIIPTKDAQDYVISMANKAQEEISKEEEVKTSHKLRLRFWTAFLNAIKGKSKLFQNSSPTKEQFLIAGGADITYVSYQLIITKSDTSVVLNFGMASQTENKTLFDTLYLHKSDIEEAFGDLLVWEKMEDKKSSKVSYYRSGLNYYNEEDWPNIIEFSIEYLNKLQNAVSHHLVEVKSTLQHSIKEIQESFDENGQ